MFEYIELKLKCVEDWNNSLKVSVWEKVEGENVAESSKVNGTASRVGPLSLRLLCGGGPVIIRQRPIYYREDGICIQYHIENQF